MDQSKKKLMFLLVGGALLAWMLWPSKASAAEQPTALPPSPEPQPPAPSIPGGTQYSVQAGDSLSLIAAKTYGDGTIGKKNTGWKWWPHLWDVNKTVIGCNWNALRIGMVITLPAASSLPAQDAIFARASNWKNPPKAC